MIIGFEEETQPLTDEELAMVPMFVVSFQKRIGEANAVTSNVIIEKMNKLGHKMSGSRVRKIINHIRVNRILRNLVATSKGYYIEHDREKIRQYVKGLKDRARAILAVADSYE